MSWNLTKKQRAYKAYLKSAHWKALRDLAIERDGGKCKQCGSSEFLQVHHLIYRETFEASVVGDLETRCRKCHRKEHGYGPSDYEVQHRKVDLMRRYFKNDSDRVPPDEWRKLFALIEVPVEMEAFGRLLFSYMLDIGLHRHIGERVKYHYIQWAQRWEAALEQPD